MKRVEFDVPNTVHEALFDIARQRGTTVEAVLVGAAATVAREWRHPLASKIAELHAEQMSDADIALALGMTNAQIANRRRAMGLLANPVYRPESRTR